MESEQPEEAEPNRVALQGDVVREALPLPVVFYSSTFFGFAESEEDTPALCSCVREAVANHMALSAPKPIEKMSPEERDLWEVRAVYEDPLIRSPLYGAFPLRLAEMSLEREADPMEWLMFREKLCHRCNGATPSLRWCHDMYGNEFMQHFGWYANVARCQLGAAGESHKCLSGVCPKEIIQDIEEYERRVAEMHVIQDRWGELPSWMPQDVADEYRRVRRSASNVSRRITRRFEDIARQDFGFPKVGEGWLRESFLAQIVERLFPGERVLRRDHPGWLERLELDIYLPHRGLAFEYQWEQHYDAMEHWGGDKALVALQERDRRKAALCKENGVVLLAIACTEPLMDEHILNRLAEHGISPPGRRNP